jgi:hypothetical protein
VDGGEVGGGGGITAAAVMGTDMRERGAMSVFPRLLFFFLFRQVSLPYFLYLSDMELIATLPITTT